MKHSVVSVSLYRFFFHRIKQLQCAKSLLGESLPAPNTSETVLLFFLLSLQRPHAKKKKKRQDQIRKEESSVVPLVCLPVSVLLSLVCMGDVVSRERCMLWLSLLAATSSSQPHRSPEAGRTADQSEGDAAMTKRLSPAESLFQSWTGVCVSPRMWITVPKHGSDTEATLPGVCVRACVWMCPCAFFFSIPLSSNAV